MVKQERAARTRRTLIRAAAEVFAREGFAPASLTTISRQAGVSNGALHFHFTSKNALAQAVEEEAGEAMRLLIRDVPDRGRSSALQNLVDATHGLMNQLANDVVVRAGFELYGDVAREGSFNLRQQWQQWVEETLKTAEQEDVLADDVSPQGAAHAIVAATVGFEVLGSTDKSWLSKQSITCFWELMLPRLAAGPALGEVDSAGSARTVNTDEEPSKDVFLREKTDQPV
ncbi:ScbR family autoregulator-binding transcription factor [Streptomyces sp. NPDC005283]|uniref:ScbR family autoregulator-binding transcription factor n=1 Tax=Streptomyces sp. NPDC005283 TaxID=3156871 RepID=UPI0034528CEA